ncbi:hypothetical protein D3C87_692120 [compost metagenome]
MSLLNKRYIRTNVAGNTHVIHDMRCFIKYIGLRNFAKDYGLKFNVHLPEYDSWYLHNERDISSLADFRNEFVLEDFFTGKAVDPLDIAIEFLHEHPECLNPYRIRNGYRGFVSDKRYHRRKCQRHVKTGLRSRLVERDRAKEFGFSIPSLAERGQFYEDYMPLDVKERNWKSFRKTQYK